MPSEQFQYPIGQLRPWNEWVFQIYTTFWLILKKRRLGRGIWLEFWESDETNYLNGVWSDTDLTGMLEASDSDAVDLVLPFISAIVDDCCKLFRTPETWKLFMEYVDVVDCM